ncbi:type II toxin-antitoxin system Phd/YefM family antitoxin [Mycolicibacterium anyangense]|uniref:type II toxin-antitoxin system Phd/YefM family antitoxin n=1 Tax=Mycolicibacterium anyangense TaxID=1431246 RepID=UPI002ADDF1FE|nr:type II toxin-antitoxin system Phd/YefM family antitoxin [Mycolicibacterium anyangense]
MIAQRVTIRCSGAPPASRRDDDRNALHAIRASTPSTVSSTAAKNRLNALLAEVERSGVAITITSHGRPVPRLEPVQPVRRTFG